MMSTLRRSLALIVMSAIILVGAYALMSSHYFVKINSEIKLRRKSPRDLPPAVPCTCSPGSVLLKDQVPVDQYEALEQRREKEFKEYKARRTSVLSRLLYASPNSPLQYPIQGFTVKPLTPVTIPGLGLYVDEQNNYEVSLQVSIGVLTLEISNEEATITGSGGRELRIQSHSLIILNNLLSRVSYTSTNYHINTGDLVTFQFEKHEALFPIAIKQPSLPVMWDMGTDINSQVSIIMKAFLRYPKAKVLVDSIRHFYPKIKIIIADDSIQREDITGENIDQYFMPPAKGFFAGRNLAVSQVTTKYFLWVDDDFLFTENTKLEKFVEVMEANPELDVVGGSVKGNMFHFSILYEEGEEMEGGCLYRKSGGKFQSIPGYPQCFLAHGVVNFFMARTESVWKVGFDPMLQRVAHSEFFMDGLGSLMVASCNDKSSMYIDHQSSAGNSAQYSKFRRPGGEEQKFKYQHHFFKNHLKCIRFG